MHLANLTTAGFKRIFILSFAFFIYSVASAQDNSPYSRYGVGDMVPNQNMSSRAMGGISAGYSDPYNVNFKNPASIASIYNTIFDVGGEVDIRTLKSNGISSKYSSTNAVISYLQLAFPIGTAKMRRKGMDWGLSFGLRPISRIAYKVEKNERLTSIDSLNTLYEGSGGVNQFNVSTGFKIMTSKNHFLSLGLSSGYSFGTRDYSTQKVFMNDTVAYYKSNTEAQSHYGGLFLNAGIQYEFPVKKTGFFKVGAFANFQQNLKGKQDNINETFAFDGNGGITPIDTVNYSKNISGTVKFPATYGIGFTYKDSSNHWMVGGDFEYTSWNNYRYFNQADDVQDNWTVRVGAEYYPAKKSQAAGKFRQFIRYRIGAYFGPDYIKLDKSRFTYAATVGAGIPLTRGRQDPVLLNAGLEIGSRGNKESFSFHENNLRFCVGISMNSSWFHKRSYN